MSQLSKFVNVIPNTKIKKEIIEIDDDDVEVACVVCCKGFTNEVALRNHVRMEHVDVFATGDTSAWMKKVSPIKNKPSIAAQKAEQAQQIKVKTEELLSSMGPGNLMSLASGDVSYIIIKADEIPKLKTMKKKAEIVKVDKSIVKEKKEKETHPITGPFECLQPSNLVADGTCHQIFFSCCEYSMHFRDEHTRRRKGHRCQVCEKPLGNTGVDAPFVCDVCGTGFNSNKELADHTATAHVKLKPFECSVCHKRFTQQGGVQQHMRMHTGDRPFPCTFCPKAFTQKSGLDQHLRIHTKTKPYRCVVCGKTFSQSVHLKQHMRTHTNVAPFQCAICQKKFKQSSHLNYHLKNHNPSTLNDEQKVQYAQMVKSKQVEIEIDPSNILVDDTDKEQVVAEQNIQISQDGEEEVFILSDVSSNMESWKIELVDS